MPEACAQEEKKTLVPFLLARLSAAVREGASLIAALHVEWMGASSQVLDRE